MKKLEACLCLFTWLAAGLGVEAQDRKEITVEWVFGDEASQAQTVPRFQWLDNHEVILLDTRIPEGERSFELLDPNSGRRRAVLNVNDALESLKELIGGTKAPSSLAWPLAFDGRGDQALYTFDGDIFLLNLPQARFKRLTQTGEVELGPTLSPDGQKIAYGRDNDIFVYDLENGKEQQVTSDGSETLYNGRLSFMYWEDVFFRNNGVGFWWSPDSRALAFLQTDVSQVTELVYYDIKPFHPRVIRQRYPLVGETIETVRVGVHDLDRRRTTWLKGTGIPDEYVVSVKWLHDNERISFQTLNRNQDILDLYLADRTTGRSTHLLRETDEAWVNVSGDLYFLKDNERFIWGSERSGYKHLYLYGLDGKLIRQITKGDWAVRGPFQVAFWWGQSVVSIDESNGWIYFTSLEKSALERHLYRIKLDGGGMARITDRDGFHSVVFSQDSRRYLDVYSNRSTPPSLALHRNDGALTKVLAEPATDVLRERAVEAPDLFTVPTTDGFEMPAMVFKPKDFDAEKKYPVIMYHYGGPSAPTVLDIWNGYTFFNQILLDKGYLVVTIDNRSATAKSKTLENLVHLQMFGSNELNDLIDGVKWLKSQPYVDPDRVGIWGWSYGGCYTLLGMTQSKEFKAGIAVAAVSDQRFHEPKWAEFAMKKPQDHLEAWEDVSLLKHARDLHGRLLLVHGTYDDNVRIQNLWAFVDKLIGAGKNFDMMVYPMRKHGIADRPARVHLFKKMVEFWCRHL